MAKKTNLKRYKEILSVLTKNGLGFLFVKKNIFKQEESYESMRDEARQASSISVGKRIRKTCEDLGPTFIKLGQILSTRTDIISENVAKELSRLQDCVTPYPFDMAKSLIEEEFSAKIEDIFCEFNETPVASASMSQVYLAKLRNGMKVAVKVRRPGIEQIIDVDSKILLSIARFVDRHTKYGALYEFEGMVKEFVSVLKKELDFTIEANNTEILGENIKNDKKVCTPKIKWIYTTEKVITMEYIEGIKITDVASLKKAGTDTAALSKTFVDSLIMQMLTDGFFQADPHPGNEIIKDDGKLCFIDIGMAGTLSERSRQVLTSLLIGLSLKNSRKVARAVIEMGKQTVHVNEALFERKINELLDEFLYVPLSDVKITKVFMGIFNIAREFKIKIPKEITLVAKSLGTAQSVVDTLDPNVNMLKIAQDCAVRIAKKMLTPEKMIEETLSYAVDIHDAVKEAPAALGRFLHKMQETDFVLELKIKDIEKIEKKVDNVGNRIAFAVVLLAVAIVMAGIILSLSMTNYLLAEEQQAVAIDLSVVGLVLGLIIAGAIVFGIIFSILISRRKK